ncbi:T9SS type A sorting domain-containing protein [Hymenobacter cellulosivorans]|uniref:T9SS type A sorting domain-containing protein n=1 Tax=Hymenobacter cellulosivorans TaxID=2932249 RepID=A0ABY4F6K4_9BACT|nr:T9SS type A sorting domain-containing protein [Hymenobacter cellulosivorans]UOQ52296.1 T9SS type A sorting domain-containing protein [Hymenobacter cellulosivorans]
MKKVLLAACILASTAASAQVTLENTYVLNSPLNSFESLNPIKLSTGETKYVKYNKSTRLITVYNANHSQFKQFTPPVPPAGYTSTYIDYVSDKLFNQDGALEYVASYTIEDNTSGTTVNSEYVYSETGALLARSDSSYVTDIINTSTGTKMLVEKQSTSTSSGRRTKVLVFALPGTYTTLKAQKGQNDALAMPYPNPATESMRLPYSVKAGTTATLRITDAAGRQVNTYQVDSTFDHLALDVRKLHSGVYFYQVIGADGAASSARRFVVSH